MQVSSNQKGVQIDIYIKAKGMSLDACHSAGDGL